MNKSDFILIGARPAMGKTSFALNLASNVSMMARKKCVFFSLEMTKEQLAERLLASQPVCPAISCVPASWTTTSGCAWAMLPVNLMM